MAVIKLQLNEKCYCLATQSTLSYWEATTPFNGYIFKELHRYWTGNASLSMFALIYVYQGLFPSFLRLYSRKKTSCKLCDIVLSLRRILLSDNRV